MIPGPVPGSVSSDDAPSRGGSLPPPDADDSLRPLPADDGWSKEIVAGSPAPGEIWLWRANLRLGERQRRSCLEWLSPDERERVVRAGLPEVARRFTVSRGMLRQVLGACLDVAPAAVGFRYGTHGKPDLNDRGAPLRFNLSHSGDLAVLAVTVDSDLGVDIERIRPGIDIARIANRYLSQGDADRLRGTTDDQRDREFFRCWTLREARLKAAGCGWVGNAAYWDEGENRSETSPGEFTYEFTPCLGYLGALAILGACRIVRKFQWPATAGILE